MPVPDLQGRVAESKLGQFVGGVLQDLGTVVDVRRRAKAMGRSVVGGDVNGADSPPPPGGQVDCPVQGEEPVS